MWKALALIYWKKTTQQYEQRDILGGHRSSYPQLLELIMVQRLETFCYDTELSVVYSLNFTKKFFKYIQRATEAPAVWNAFI